MALAYSQFGLVSPVLYAAYLGTFYDGDRVDSMVGSERVLDSVVGSVACDSGGAGARGCDSFSDAEAVSTFRALCSGSGGRSRGVAELAECRGGRFGQAAASVHLGSPVVGSGGGDDSCKVFGANGSVGTVVGGVECTDAQDGVVRGKWYKKNRARKQRSKVCGGKRGSLEKLEVSEPSRCETVYSSSASTLAEGRARETLALRRVAENELATEKAKALVRSYRDSKKTEALAELSALRIVQRANDARARSQESWRKCDESLGSLGSTGSAGEFQMKREVQKGKEFEVKYEYARKQCMLLMANATPDVLEECRKMPVPVSKLCSDQEFAEEMLDFEMKKDLEEMIF